MTDWTTLSHAYGTAEDIPKILAKVSPDLDTELWNDIWLGLTGRLCHQGTVYSASFAALPELARVAAQLAPKDRTEPLMLAVYILESDDVYGDSREEFLRPYESALDALKACCDDSLGSTGMPRADFLRQLQARRAFDGDFFWGMGLACWLEGDDSSWGKCPSCRTEIYTVIGEFGFFVTDTEPYADYMKLDPKTLQWVQFRPKELRADIKQYPITPCTTELPDIGQWLVERAQSAQQDDVARWIPYLFGTGNCPHCNEAAEILSMLAFGIGRHDDDD